MKKVSCYIVFRDFAPSKQIPIKAYNHPTINETHRKPETKVSDIVALVPLVRIGTIGNWDAYYNIFNAIYSKQNHKDEMNSHPDSENSFIFSPLFDNNVLDGGNYMIQYASWLL